MNTYEKLVNLFIQNCKRNDLSKNTIDSYARTFRFFADSMEKNGYTDPSLEAVLTFKLGLENVALTTLDLYLRHLNLLSDFGEKSGICKSFVNDSVMPSKKKVAKERKKEYDHVLSEEQMNELITAESPKFSRKPHTWLREKAIVTLLLTSGLRNSELRNITVADLDWQNQTIFARVTKGDKPRHVAFSGVAQNAIRSYLSSDLVPENMSADSFLFGCFDRATKEWKQFDRSQLSTLVYNYTKSILGEENAIHTHAARHGYASFLLENNVPVQMISESLGHASLSTTSIYAQRLTKTAPATVIGSAFDSFMARAV